jgi:hypothetical protein
MAISKTPKEALSKATKRKAGDTESEAVQKSFHAAMLSKTYRANWSGLEGETLRNYEKQLPGSKKRN